MLQMGDTISPRYTAPKISAISYLFFFINNGRHRMTALYRFPRSIGPRYNGAAVYYFGDPLPKLLKQFRYVEQDGRRS